MSNTIDKSLLLNTDDAATSMFVTKLDIMLETVHICDKF